MRRHGWQGKAIETERGKLGIERGSSRSELVDRGARARAAMGLSDQIITSGSEGSIYIRAKTACRKPVARNDCAPNCGLAVETATKGADHLVRGLIPGNGTRSQR